MRRIYVILAVFVVLAMTVGSTAATPFKVGCITPLTGGGAGAGVHIKYGAELAVAEINAAGGVGGRPVELIVVDDAGIPAQSVSAANKLIYQDNVDFLIGGNISSTVLAHMQVVEKAGVPYIVTTASNALITRPENKWVVRLHQNDDIQSAHLADFLVNVLGKNKISILYDAGDYGVGCKNAFTKRLQELGLDPVISLGFNWGDKDFMSQLIRIREKNPDTVALFGQQAEAAIITNQMRQLGMNALICTTGGFVVPKYIELAPGTSEGAIGITTFSPFADDPVVKTFVDTYEKKYKTLPTHHAWNTYEAFKYILKPLVDKVGTDKAKMRDALRSWKWTALGVEKYFDETGQVIMPSLFIEVQNGVWKPFKG
ncbi:MAG: ABC transporter substrate-binding protein [Firmicutes bacterium]|jgi:branched-chain amino acid transport system substrate-binding protein|nr:ABC transporter substrate-binding protein [Bacillota bacterium]